MTLLKAVSNDAIGAPLMDDSCRIPGWVVTVRSAMLVMARVSSAVAPSRITKADNKRELSLSAEGNWYKMRIEMIMEYYWPTSDV